MAENPSGPSVAHPFGPDPATVGGMATVIRVLTEHNVGGDIVDSHPTWRPESPLTTVRMVAAAARALLRMPGGQVAHIHLSERGSFLREGSLVALAHKRGLVTVATIHGASFLPFARRYPRLVSIRTACTNTAFTSYFASILGGTGNQASAENASVSGGKENKATGEGSSVSGGGGGEASGVLASVTGGRLGKAPYFASTVLGGLEEVTEKQFGVTP